MYLIRNVVLLLYRVWAFALFLLILLLGLTVWLAGCIVFYKKNKRKWWTWQICRIKSQSILICSGVFVREIFLYESKKRDAHELSTAIYVANHASYIDVLTLYVLTLPMFSFLAKHTFVKIPFFGMLYADATIAVDRSRMESRGVALKKLYTKLKDDKGSILIFPEGTFSTQPSLLPFQPGAFSLAIKAQIPLKPLLLIDTAKRMSPSSFWKLTPGKNRVVHIPVIDIHLKQNISAIELMQHTRNVMLKYWDKYKKISS